MLSAGDRGYRLRGSDREQKGEEGIAGEESCTAKIDLRGFFCCCFVFCFFYPPAVGLLHLPVFLLAGNKSVAGFQLGGWD